LLKAQSGPFEEIIDMVFDHPSFEFINSKEAYELFKLLCEENGYSRSMTKTNFDSRLENELHMSHTHTLSSGLFTSLIWQIEKRPIEDGL
jgi:hypothetical protein